MEITASHIEKALRIALPNIAYSVRPDYMEALSNARLAACKGSREFQVLDLLYQNDVLANKEKRPLCQDTGSVWVNLEISHKDSLAPGALSYVNDVVAQCYLEGKLRKSIVKDALLDRANTQTNTPTFIEITISDKNFSQINILLKGGGSDNASVLKMLNPGDGFEGVKNFLIDTVIEKASKACPPLLIGLGVGGTFDSVASLAKHQLLRPIGSENPHKELNAIEKELLLEVNALGIGPGGLGGNTTAFAVHIGTAPCHIAALPVAINMGCSATRSMSINLAEV